MPKKKKLTTHELKHDAFLDGYRRLAEWVIRKKDPIRRTGRRAAVVPLVIAGIYLGIHYWEARAARNLANAIEIINAEVGSTPSADPSRRHYATDDEKYNAALVAFRPLASKWYDRFSGRRDLARYYVAISQLHLDPAAGQAELRKIADSSLSEKRMARLSLAESYAATDRFDEAGALYQQLVQDPGDLPRAPIQLAWARTLSHAGKKTEAVDLYLKIATENRSEENGRQAIEQLALLDPAALDRVPPEPKAQGETDRLAKYKKK